MAASRNKRCTDLQAQLSDFLVRNVAPGTRLAVAFSGGLDSRVLLDLAHQFAKTADVRLSAFHVHHGLSLHADDWLRFCAATCAAYPVPFESVRIAVPKGTGEGLEAAARRVRYKFFAAIEAEHVLLAQHQDDQAETLLLNLLRGCGVRGSAGMLPESGSRGRYLRPLLGVSRKEIEAYALQHGLHWIEDDSNTDTRFSRNFVRHEVIPVLARRFPAAAENLARAAAHFAEAQRLLDQLAQIDLQGHAASFPVPVSMLADLSEERASNLLRYLLAQHGLQPPASTRLAEVLRQFLTAAPDRHPELKLPAYRLFRRKGVIEIFVAGGG